MRQPVGGTDDHDLLADPHGVGITDLGHPHGRWPALELQEGDIGGRIGRDDLRAHGLTGDAFDCDLVHAVDHVGGRHHLAAAGDQDTGACLIETGDAPGADIAPLAPHDDDGRVDPAENVVQVLGPGRRYQSWEHNRRAYHGGGLLYSVSPTLRETPLRRGWDQRPRSLSPTTPDATPPPA